MRFERTIALFFTVYSGAMAFWTAVSTAAKIVLGVSDWWCMVILGFISVWLGTFSWERYRALG